MQIGMGPNPTSNSLAVDAVGFWSSIIGGPNVMQSSRDSVKTN
jgi:hypothetical protein